MSSEGKSLKKSIPRSHGKTKQKSVRRSKKKLSRTSPEIQFKNWMKNLEVLWPADQLNNNSQNTSKIIPKNWKTNKLNKNILIAKTLKASTSWSKFDPFEDTFLKICSKPISVSEISTVLYLQDLRKFIDPWRSVNSKMTIEIKPKFKEMLQKTLILISSVSFICL